MSTQGWIFASVVIVSLVSLVGALTLTVGFLRRHVVLLGLVAMAAGALLGDSLLHLLPHAVEARGGLGVGLATLVLGGFLVFFLLETALRWNHQHGELEHQHGPTPTRVAPYAFTNLVGDGFHNFIDGALIAAAYSVDLTVGFATTVAVAAHEIPQELGDFAILLKAGVRTGRALLYNLLSALLAVLGAAAVVFLPLDAEQLEAVALPLIAGGFLYIAAADLVPELHHHSERRYLPVILGGLGVGLLLMYALLFYDPSGAA